jgi:hypothetical protein
VTRIICVPALEARQSLRGWLFNPGFEVDLVATSFPLRQWWGFRIALFIRPVCRNAAQSHFRSAQSVIRQRLRQHARPKAPSSCSQ